MEPSLDNEMNLLNEITALNNELINTQRDLVKKNAEVNTLNKQLSTVNSQLEQFTYVASHDLKEPLRMITGFMQLLKNKYGDLLDKNANSYIDFALDGGNRLGVMMNDLLDYSRIGKVKDVKKAANINDMLQLTIHDLGKLILENNAVILVQPGMPVLKVYRSELARLFQNLISNAIKFRKKDTAPLININAEEKDSEWQFSIKDNGIGIEKEKFDKVFEIFSRLHSKNEYDGSGIGLAICKNIVQHHGGRIWITSEKGEGSIFHFTLPKE